MGFKLHSCRRLLDNARLPRRSGRESRKAVYPNELTPATGRASACHGFHLLAEVRGESPNLRGFLRATDVSGAGQIGGLQARSSGYSSGTGAWSTHDFYHADGNPDLRYGTSTWTTSAIVGVSMTAMVNGSGTLRAYYRFNTFGRYRASVEAIAGANTMRFSSKPRVGFQSSLTEGLYFYGDRFYDPYLQRWVNRDPIGEGGGLNLYGLIGNQPVSGTDALGHKAIWSACKAFWRRIKGVQVKTPFDGKDLPDEPNTDKSCAQEAPSRTTGLE